MATTVQVAFDGNDPHAMARFWAAAVGYEKEDHSELIAGLLESGAIGEDDACWTMADIEGNEFCVD